MAKLLLAGLLSDVNPARFPRLAELCLSLSLSFFPPLQTAPKATQLPVAI